MVAAWRTARIKVSFPRRTLKALCSCGFACAKAASAASASDASLILRPFSFCSAACARQGVAETPPSAMRTCRTVLPSQIKRDSCRGERKFVRLPVPDFQVKRPLRPCCRRHHERKNQFARRERRFDMRTFARRAMKPRKRQSARALWSRDFNFGIERDECLGKVSGISCDAVVAGAEYGMRPIDALQRCAARAGIAFVAGGV